MDFKKIGSSAYNIVLLGRTFLLIITGSIGVHIMVMFVDYYTVKKPMYINFQDDFLGSSFAMPMLPSIAAYTVFCVATWVIWKKMKKALIRATAIEVSLAQEQSAVKTMQHITGLVAEHITQSNAEILNWIHSKKQKGEKAPRTVETAANNIARVLKNLSDVAFIMPYASGPLNERLKDIETLLEKGEEHNEI